MAGVFLNSNNIGEYANKTVKILRYADDKVPKKILAEQLGLTLGQVSTVVKYMRRCAEDDLERYIPYYPISSKKGYTLPHNYYEFLPCFATLYSWCCSLSKTIEPMRKKMEKEGIDVIEYLRDKRHDEADNPENYLTQIFEMNADTSWFLED